MSNGIVRSNHKYTDSCKCKRCLKHRHHLFTVDARRTSQAIERRGNASITAALAGDGIYTDPYTTTVVGEVDAAGNLYPSPHFKPQSVTDTQLRQGRIIFSPSGRTTQQQHSNIVVTVKDGKEVTPSVKDGTIIAVKQTSGFIPVKSLLRHRANFDLDLGLIKRQTSRTKQIVIEPAHTIDPSTSRISYRNPNFLHEQADQEVKMLDLELGLPNDDITDPTAPVQEVTPLARNIDDELADLTDFD